MLLPVPRLCRPQPHQGDDSPRRRVPATIPAPRRSAWLHAHPPLRDHRQSPPRAQARPRTRAARSTPVSRGSDAPSGAGPGNCRREPLRKLGRALHVPQMRWSTALAGDPPCRALEAPHPRHLMKTSDPPHPPRLADDRFATVRQSYAQTPLQPPCFGLSTTAASRCATSLRASAAPRTAWRQQQDAPSRLPAYPHRP
jgi:hypothetical protein